MPCGSAASLGAGDGANVAELDPVPAPDPLLAPLGALAATAPPPRPDVRDVGGAKCVATSPDRLLRRAAARWWWWWCGLPTVSAAAGDG